MERILEMGEFVLLIREDGGQVKAMVIEVSDELVELEIEGSGERVVVRLMPLQ